MGVYPMGDGTNQKVKVKVRINLHGIFGVNSANFIEKQEIEEEVPMEVDEAKEDNNKKETKEDISDNASNEKPSEKVNGEKVEDSEMKDAEKKEGEDKEKKDNEKGKKSPPKMVKKKKTVAKTIDLPITSQAVGSLPKTKLETATAQESNFAQKDLQESDRLLAKNSVEEYIYDIRGKIHDELEEYLAEETRGVFSNQLEDAENWLYEM